jgi:Tfp pilus assembly protein PilE
MSCKTYWTQYGLLQCDYNPLKILKRVIIKGSTAIDTLFVHDGDESDGGIMTYDQSLWPKLHTLLNLDTSSFYRCSYGVCRRETFTPTLGNPTYFTPPPEKFELLNTTNPIIGSIEGDYDGGFILVLLTIVVIMVGVLAIVYVYERRRHRRRRRREHLALLNLHHSINSDSSVTIDSPSHSSEIDPASSHLPTTEASDQSTSRDQSIGVSSLSVEPLSNVSYDQSPSTTATNPTSSTLQADTSGLWGQSTHTTPSVIVTDTTQSPPSPSTDDSWGDFVSALDTDPTFPQSDTAALSSSPSMNGSSLTVVTSLPPSPAKEPHKPASSTMNDSSIVMDSVQLSPISSSSSTVPHTSTPSHASSTSVWVSLGSPSSSTLPISSPSSCLSSSTELMTLGSSYELQQRPITQRQNISDPLTGSPTVTMSMESEL